MTTVPDAPPAGQQRTATVPELDGVRGLAILLVLEKHFLALKKYFVARTA